LDPRAALTDANLDAFCVLVEEISHFHLILNRAQAGLEVTKLELEWQGEVDKLLVSGLFLERQSGQSYLLPLARKLYDLAAVTAVDDQLYEEATKYAARFWFQLAKDADLRLDSPRLRDRLRQAYRCGWTDKVQNIAA
jgi:hypothetical protein